MTQSTHTIPPARTIKIGINFGDGARPVGVLAIRDGQIYFQYDAQMIQSGLEISPRILPLESGVKSGDRSIFNGLFGVFNDSLADGWGQILFNRLMRKHGITANALTPLDRLAYVGGHGLGALTYQPDVRASDENIGVLDLDILAAEVETVLNDEADTALEKLHALGGSSAGARPKALIAINEERNHILHGTADCPDGYTRWIVKFPNDSDGADAGAIEYIYALMAVEAGIAMPLTHLFPAQHGAGYFAIKRFDREGRQRYHTHTASGLLHSDFRTPSMDYEDLITLTGGLTGDLREMERMYRCAVFNVLAHNRDDHAKNFTFLMDSTGQWRLSPAYDLTFSSGLNGEQSTTVMGEGRAPNTTHLLALAEATSIAPSRANAIIEATKESLARWLTLAQDYGVGEATAHAIDAQMKQNW